MKIWKCLKTIGVCFVSLIPLLSISGADYPFIDTNQDEKANTFQDHIPYLEGNFLNCQIKESISSNNTYKSLNPTKCTQHSKNEQNLQPTICLTMIVKNESQVIKRCIDSVKDYINYWVIVDTGSTDGTQALIKEIMAEYKIAGELYERPWVDFGHNRTESLQYSKNKADYILIIDADDVLVIEDPNVNPFSNLTKDFYKILIRLGSLSYYRSQIIRGTQDWKYVGVLHEYLSGPKDRYLEEDILCGVEMHATVSGHNRELKGKDKYLNDALIFEKAISNTPKEDLPLDLERRYVFYMAQSYKDAGLHEKSIEAYQRRINLGGWHEEVYISKYLIARQKQHMDLPECEIINAYLNAWEYRPKRLEALYYLIKFLANQKRYAFAYALSVIGMKTGPCSDILFVEDEIWKWKMSDEYSVLAYYNGEPEEAFRTTSILINSPVFNKISPQDQQRIHMNLSFYQKAIEEKKLNELLLKDF